MCGCGKRLAGWGVQMNQSWMRARHPHMTKTENSRHFNFQHPQHPHITKQKIAVTSTSNTPQHPQHLLNTPMPSKLSHLLPANYPISISGTLSTTIFCHRGHYFFSLSPTESCFPLTFTRAPRARWGTRRMPIVMFLCDEGVSAATTFVAKKHPQ